VSTDGPRIEGFIFDFGGVLMVQHPDDYAVWDEKYGMQKHTLWKSLYRIPEFNELQVGRGDEEAYRLGVRRALIAGGCTDVDEMLTLWWNQPPPSLHEPVIKLIRRLRGHYKLGLLSNATITLEDRLVEYGLHEELFDDIVNSSRVGLAKPDPAIYQLAATRLELDPVNCFFIDDYHVNVRAAREVGMTAHHFQGYQGLHDELEALSLLPEAGNPAGG
jgi:putative hydrolase of the HAD superfamily